MNTIKFKCPKCDNDKEFEGDGDSKWEENGIDYQEEFYCSSCDCVFWAQYKLIGFEVVDYAEE